MPDGFQSTAESQQQAQHVHPRECFPIELLSQSNQETQIPRLGPADNTPYHWLPFTSIVLGIPENLPRLCNKQTPVRQAKLALDRR